METKKLKIISTTSDNFEEILKKAGDNNLDHNSWWYLHGDLEKLFHYDKAVIYNMSELPEDEYRETLKWYTIIGNKTKVSEFKTCRMSHLEGIYPVEVYGVSEKCVGYFWVTDEREITASLENNPDITKKFKIWDQLGLVVLKPDFYGNEWAKSKYEKRSSNL